MKDGLAEPRARRRRTAEAIGIGGGIMALLAPVVGWLAFGASLVVTGRLSAHKDVSLASGVLVWGALGALGVAGGLAAVVAGIAGLRLGPPRSRSALALVLVAIACLVWGTLWSVAAWKISHTQFRY